jgi:hypothetical protein
MQIGKSCGLTGMEKMVMFVPILSTIVLFALERESVQ